MQSVAFSYVNSHGRLNVLGQCMQESGLLVAEPKTVGEVIVRFGDADWEEIVKQLLEVETSSSSTSWPGRTAD